MALKPDVLQTVLGFAKMEEADRKFDAALKLLDEAERSSARQSQRPAHPRHRPRPPEKDRSGAGHPARSRRKRKPCRNSGPRASGKRPPARPARPLPMKPSRPFDAAKKRARAQCGAPTYMARSRADLATRLKGFFIERRLKTLPVAEPRRDMPQPIFIVGFPRSGTTLIEQTLTGPQTDLRRRRAALYQRHHPDHAASAGKPARLPGGAGRIMDGRPARRPELSCATITSTAPPKADFPGRARDFFTDKMPLNETHLGLISLLFPNSPIIHVIRHPLDVLLSVYSNHLTHGFFCAAQTGDHRPALRSGR